MAQAPRVLILNGPNLNLLGQREPEHYGTLTLAEIEAAVSDLASELEVEIEFFQSNDEGALVDRVQARGPEVDGWVVNAAAFTHTSVAVRDALQASGRPFVEVHLSNVHAREPFRQHSYFSDVAVGVISGLGVESYQLALTAAISRVDD